MPDSLFCLLQQKRPACRYLLQQPVLLFSYSVTVPPAPAGSRFPRWAVRPHPVRRRKHVCCFCGNYRFFIAGHFNGSILAPSASISTGTPRLYIFEKKDSGTLPSLPPAAGIPIHACPHCCSLSFRPSSDGSVRTRAGLPLKYELLS